MIELELPGARVAFTTRAGGVSEGPYSSLNLGLQTGDDEARVRENRRRLGEWAGVPIVMGRQVHGTEIAHWPSAEAPPPPEGEAPLPPEVDGHTTTTRGLAPLVLVADCVPVVLAGRVRIAVLHCGWRGLAGGIAERALALFDEPPAAAVGPGIGGCCYEVGPEVLAAFADVPEAADGRMLDLRTVVRHKLVACERVEQVDLCTSCRPDLFFSHRRDAGVTGRQAGLAWLR